MQKGIKFRGKRLDTGQWVYGYYVERFNNDHVIYASEIHNGDCFLAAYSVIPETVGQYTGLRDENGKGIYEGDILSFTTFGMDFSDTQYKGIVVWENGMYEIWHDAKEEYYGSDGGFILQYVWLQDDEIEVIGNIYDNPELLQEVPNE